MYIDLVVKLNKIKAGILVLKLKAELLLLLLLLEQGLNSQFKSS